MPGRPVEQDPLRHARAELREALRVAQKVDDLLHLVARLLEPGDLVPRDRRLEVGLTDFVLTRGITCTVRHSR